MRPDASTPEGVYCASDIAGEQELQLMGRQVDRWAEACEVREVGGVAEGGGRRSRREVKEFGGGKQKLQLMGRQVDGWTEACEVRGGFRGGGFGCLKRGGGESCSR